MRDCGIIDKLTSAGAPQKKNGKMLTDAAPPHIRVIMVQFWNEEGWVEWFGNMKQERDLLERMERRNNVEAKDKDLYSFIEVRVSSASSAGKRALDADEVDGDGEAKDGMSTMGAVGGGEPTNKKRKKSFRMKPNTESARSIGKSILHSDKTFGSAPKSTADYAKMFALPIRHLSADSQPIASSSTSGNPLQSRTASEMDVDVQADEEISKDIERNEVGMIVRTGLGKGGVVQTTVDVGAFAAGLPDVDEMNNPFSGFGFKPGEDDGERKSCIELQGDRIFTDLVFLPFTHSSRTKARRSCRSRCHARRLLRQQRIRIGRSGEGGRFGSQGSKWRPEDRVSICNPPSR